MGARFSALATLGFQQRERHVTAAELAFEGAIMGRWHAGDAFPCGDLSAQQGGAIGRCRDLRLVDPILEDPLRYIVGIEVPRIDAEAEEECLIAGDVARQETKRVDHWTPKYSRLKAHRLVENELE